MSKDLIVIILGILVAIMPFLGFPRSWETIIFLISGLIIAILGLILRGKLIAYSSRMFSSEKRTDAYVENGMNNNSNREET
jgi:hypothetical protein